jgi:hypothetical protein
MMKNRLIARNTPAELAIPTGVSVTRRPQVVANGNGHTRYQQRAFTAAATPINPTNRTEANRIKKLRQPWQEEAWEYRDAIGELRYATTYLGNAARRMVLVPSAYVPGELNPVPLIDIEDCPSAVLAAANDALERLATGGAVALGGMLRDITENFEVAGECFLVGREQDGQETWEIRSISEVNVNSDGAILLRDVAASPNSNQGEPLTSGYIARLWWPHPRRKAYADSPFKAILDLCEELLILGRDIRAAGRSRLANNGILLVPDSLSIVRSNTEEDANDAQDGDAFFQELIAAGMAAIADEGSAAAILPLIARGPKEDLAAVRQITIARQEATRSGERQELITRMATGLDLPAEVLTGKAGLNHWTSWQVSDDTFRHHIEPVVMVETDALTLGYYRPELMARQVDENWINRIVLWYDPTNLVTKPDRTEDATKAWDRMAISDEAYRNYLGFTDEDQPEPLEILARMVRKGAVDPTIAAQVAQQWDENIDITGVSSGPPQIQMLNPGPGEKPKPQEVPPEETGSPVGLPASAQQIGHAILELIQGGGSEEFGGPGSGRYPKGSGKSPSGDGAKGEGEHTPTAKGAGESIGVGSRTDLGDEGVASPEALASARDTAKAKYEAQPPATDADRAEAEARHARSKRQGGDDRPGSQRRKVLRQQLMDEYGDGTKAPCIACGRNVTATTVSLERLKPGADGGRYVLANLAPMDYDCNRVRSNSDFNDLASSWAS